MSEDDKPILFNGKTSGLKPGQSILGGRRVITKTSDMIQHGYMELDGDAGKEIIFNTDPVVKDLVRLSQDMKGSLHRAREENNPKLLPRFISKSDAKEYMNEPDADLAYLKLCAKYCRNITWHRDVLGPYSESVAKESRQEEEDARKEYGYGLKSALKWDKTASEIAGAISLLGFSKGIDRLIESDDFPGMEEHTAQVALDKKSVCRHYAPYAGIMMENLGENTAVFSCYVLSSKSYDFGGHASLMHLDKPYIIEPTCKDSNNSLLRVVAASHQDSKKPFDSLKDGGYVMVISPTGKVAAYTTKSYSGPEDVAAFRYALNEIGLAIKTIKDPIKLQERIDQIGSTLKTELSDEYKISTQQVADFAQQDVNSITGGVLTKFLDKKYLKEYDEMSEKHKKPTEISSQEPSSGKKR